MFGYVTAFEPEMKVKDFRKYKAYYCGLCSKLKKKYGNIGQLTLTYDMTFAIVLLTSLYESTTHDSKCRCKVHPLKKQVILQNDITEYAADMNLILAYYHMVDDWCDEKKISALLLSRMLHRKVRNVIQKYPRQSRAIRRELKQLSVYENNREMNIDLPAGCFGRLMEELFVYKEDIWEKRLRRMGFFLGKYIYIMDAYDDLEKDKQKGNYNPLLELSKKQDYEEQIREILCMMMGECTAVFETLPCLLDVDILRNILYDGVWVRYRKIQDKKREEQEKHE